MGEGIKAKVGELDGMPQDEQRSIYSGHQLEDGRTLRDCNVPRASTLHVVQRLSGGKAAFISSRRPRSRRRRFPSALCRSGRSPTCIHSPLRRILKMDGSALNGQCRPTPTGRSLKKAQASSCWTSSGHGKSSLTLPSTQLTCWFRRVLRPRIPGA